MNRIRDLNRSILTHYTDQPDQLPAEIRKRVEDLWGGKPIQLYGLADLDASLRLRQTWVILGSDEVVLARGRNGETSLRSIPRSRIKDVKETAGLSCTHIALCGDPEERPLAELRYTQRQRRTMDNIRLVLEQDLLREGTPEIDPDDFYADTVAEPIRNAQAAIRGTDLAILWRLIGYLRPYKKQVSVGFVTAIIMTLFGLIPPYLTGHIVDEVTTSLAETGADATETSRLLWTVLGVLTLCYGVHAFCLWIRLRFMSRLGECVAHDLRRDLYNHLQTLSMRFFSRKQTGSIISRVSSDTDRLWDFIAFGILDVSISALMLTGLGAVLFLMDWRLALIMTVPVPVILWSFFAHGRRINRIFLKAWRRWSELTSVLSGTIPGIRVVKAFNQEQKEIVRFGRRNAECLTTSKRADRLLVIKDGRLVECGTHAELLEVEDGVFRRLHEMQQELHEQFTM